jgi:hypothetical protein
MGLDVYVGTLTRYYAGEWETVVQRAGRELGMEVRIERQNEVADALRDPAEIEELVIYWRDRLNAGLGDNLAEPLAWTEGLAPPYFTDKPAWDCYGALLIWAAHEEHPDTALPAVLPEEWTKHPAVARSQTQEFRSRYAHLLDSTELWLPGEFDFTFNAEDPTGSMIGMGSVPALAAELRELNDRTWRADPATLQQWRRAGSEHGGPFETSARFGFAVLASLADVAAEHQLPMKLDY